MRKIIFTNFALIVFTWTVLAQMPSTISFQGVLRDGSGMPVADNGYSVTFKLYDAATSGNLIWTEVQTIQVQNGVFTAQLGSVTSFSGVAFDKQYWVQVTVGGVDMSPRIALTASPYAMSLKGTDNVFPNSGNVGIGTLSPTGKLQVQGNLVVNGDTYLYGFLGASSFGDIRFTSFGKGIYDNSNKPLLRQHWTSENGDFLFMSPGHLDTTKNIIISNDKGTTINGPINIIKTRNVWSGNNQYDHIVVTETAATDCMVYGYSSWQNSGSITMQGIVNDTVVVSTGRQRMNSDDTQSICFPVPKGSTWKVRVNSDSQCGYTIFRSKFGQ